MIRHDDARPDIVWLPVFAAIVLVVALGAACSTDDRGASGGSEAARGSGDTSGGTIGLDGGSFGQDLTTSTGQDAGPNMTADSGSNNNGFGGGPDASLGADGGGAAQGNTNVNLSGASDFGYVRRLLADGIVPQPDDFDAAGFFAEHHTPLPAPDCGERVCLQALLGVMGNLLNGENCTLLQLGLNSPIVADPSQRPPLSLAVVIDVSGSMQSAGKMDFVIDGLGLLIDSLHDEDQIALVTYSDRADVVFDMDAVADNRVALRGIADSLVATGGTNLHAGLERGYHEVMDFYDSGRQNRVILLSDGQPTAGITDGPTIVQMSTGYNSEGIGLTTVGLGTDFNVELMRGLAERADGNFYFVEDASAVDEVFSEEVSYFTVPVAFDLVLDVAAGSDYTFGRAYGSSLWEDTEQGGHLEVPSVFLAHRVAHDDVTQGGGRRGGGSALLLELMPRVFAGDNTDAEVAIIDVSFREPGSDEVIEDQIVVDYPLPPWEVLEVGFFEETDPAIIQKSFVMLNVFVGIEAACRLFHGGEGGEALAMLERLSAAVEDYNDEVADVDIDFDLELLSDLADVIRNNGASEPEDVFVPEDPWPAD